METKIIIPLTIQWMHSIVLFQLHRTDSSAPTATPVCATASLWHIFSSKRPRFLHLKLKRETNEGVARRNRTEKVNNDSYVLFNLVNLDSYLQQRC